MLVTTNPQQTLWESILPPDYQDMPAELRGGGRAVAAGLPQGGACAP